jgi:hypothetical protein
LNIMVLYAYVCVYAFSLHRESSGRILGDKPLLFSGGVLSHPPLPEENYVGPGLVSHMYMIYISTQIFLC